ncbi:MAG: hypothetical protein P4L03_05205 [Terracidiphilus sp.]|nr:hypothetical protein [Terracidiphilus sp.]
MSYLASTLLCDGSSDRTLIPILNWLLQAHAPQRTLAEIQWADFRNRRNRPRDLTERIRRAISDFPCDILFVHRDAEAQNPDDRRTEILTALSNTPDTPPAVCVIPIRMTEAWLLLDEAAIRYASGNPRGRKPLYLPALNTVEGLADPKLVLFEALRIASEQTGRRLKNLRVDERRHRVAELMDYSRLRGIHAFDLLESELIDTLTSNGLAAVKMNN